MKLKGLDENNRIRRKLADRYNEAFRDLDLTLLPSIPDLVPNRHLYPIRTARRDDLRRFLEKCGIQALVHYPVPLPSQPALRKFVLPGQDFPVAQKACAEVLSLPLYPEFQEDEQQLVIESVRRFFKA